MVAFSFNFEGMIYQEGISNITLSYDAAQGALTERVIQADEERLAYELSIAEGNPPVEERDEDGHLLWSQEDVLEFHCRDVIEAEQTLRKAFAILIYHHWERNALRWIEKAQVDHHKLVRLVREIGYPVSPIIDDLRLLNNLLKHNNSKWGLALHKVRKDLFSSSFQPTEAVINWFDRVTLSEAHITDFINAIAASGPKSDTIRMICD